MATKSFLPCDRQIKIFEQDKLASKEITLDMLKRQRIWDKVLNKAVTPIKPEL
jgi:hypothetical protein